MTGDEFKAVLRRLGRTQIGLAQEIGVSRRTVHLWAERGPPAYAIYLISLIERYAVPAKHEAPTERPLLDPAAVLGCGLDQHQKAMTAARARAEA